MRNCFRARSPPGSGRGITTRSSNSSGASNPRLADYALSLLATADTAEDVVQDVFVALWEGRERLPEGSRLVGYLYRSVRNRALNQIRARRTSARWLAKVEPDPAVPAVAELALEDRELEQASRGAGGGVAPGAGGVSAQP